jgi:glycosyl transferase, family 25
MSEKILVPAFVINLDESPDRLAHMRSELGRAGIAFERSPGIRGDAVPENLRPYFFDAQGLHASSHTLSEIGCHAAHLAVCQRILERDIPAALVFEDDAILCEGFAELIEKILTNLPATWDIVRLTCNRQIKRAYVTLSRLGGPYRLVRYSRIPLVATGYLVSASGAKKMLRPGLRRHTFDDLLIRPWLLDNLDTFGVVPVPVTQVPFPTTIDHTRLERLLAKARQRFDVASLTPRLRTNIAMLGPTNWAKCLAVNAADHISRSVGGPQLIHRAADLLADDRDKRPKRNNAPQTNPAPSA